MRHVVDGEPALLVAAHDVVARQADDPLDEVVLGLGRAAGRRRRARRGAPPRPRRARPAGTTSSQPPGSWKTTTSPRWRSTGPGVSLETTTRSPTRRVSSIEPEGMKNAWSSQVLTTNDSASAIPTTTTISLTARPEQPEGALVAAALVAPPLRHGVDLGRAHGVAAVTAPNRSRGHTRSRTVPTTSSRGTRPGTGAASETSSPVADATTASRSWRPVSTCSRSATAARTRPMAPSDSGVERSTRCARRRVDDDEVTRVGRRPELPDEHTVSWLDGGREGGRRDEVGLEHQALHERGEEHGRDEHDHDPGTTRPGAGHGGGGGRVGDGTCAHPAEPSRPVRERRPRRGSLSAPPGCRASP